LSSFGDEPFVIDDLLQAEEHLVGVDGLYQVVGDLAADGIVHEIFGLVLGDEHDGGLLVRLFDLGKCFETRDPGHGLVQENHVDLVLFYKIDRIETVGEGLYFIAFILEEKDVGMKTFYFIVDP